jgi:hypothetical protein
MKPIRPMSTHARCAPSNGCLHPMVLGPMLATLLDVDPAARRCAGSARQRLQARRRHMTGARPCSSCREQGGAVGATRATSRNTLPLPVALGRKDEARAAMGVVVKSDPLYTLEAGSTPPRRHRVHGGPACCRRNIRRVEGRLRRNGRRARGLEQLMQMLADPDMRASRPRRCQGLPGSVGRAGRRRGAGRRAGQPVSKAAVVVPPVAVLQKVPPIPSN